MSTKNFSQTNEWVKNRLANRREFFGSRHSFFKLFQHGIVYSFLEIKNKKLKTFFHLPIFIQKWRWQLKSFLKSGKKSIQLNEIVMLDPGRVHIDEDGNIVSVYFNKIQQTLDNSRYTTINEDPKHGLQCDYSIADLEQLPFPSGKEFNEMLEEVNGVANSLRNSEYFTQEEKELIQSSLHLFLVAYVRYLAVFKLSKVKKLFFIRHYHNEGIIAAAKDCGIETIELQHGLINKHDLYYVYDPSLKDTLKNAFFPDKILLFGKYWEDVLMKGSEWKPSQFTIAGEYMSSRKANNQNLIKENLILIASQKTLDHIFIPRIKSLIETLKNYPDWRIVIKLHPSEKKIEAYQSLVTSNVELAPLKSNIYDYLEKSKIQLSIYSTTFFDAIGMSVTNFAWTGDFIGSDYAEALIEDNIAFDGNLKNIIEEYKYFENQGIKNLSRDYFYTAFSSESFGI
ncbi:MAG: hypothetical protein RL204_1017 [Bacteroidota bacterium]|jgi:hypothetical protein